MKKSSDGVTDEVLIDFAIITAVRAEHEAVCRAFKLKSTSRVKRGARVYWRGRLPLQGGKFYELVAVQSSDAASVDASLVTADTINHWSPGAVLLVGFAGAAHDGSGPDDESLGDLILGSAVYYYERGRASGGRRKPEPYMIQPSATLWNNARSLPTWKTPITAKRPDGSSKRPKVFEGVIASGEKVVADTAVRHEIVRGHRKIRAIEMEGYGFGKAVWASAGNAHNLVFKAICDRADRTKGDDWQPYAAAVAASFAKHLLLDQPLEPRNLPAPPSEEEESNPTKGSKTARAAGAGEPSRGKPLPGGTLSATGGGGGAASPRQRLILDAYKKLQSESGAVGQDEE